jgi:hypothetical protein
MCACVCLCVCICAGGRERERERFSLVDISHRLELPPNPICEPSRPLLCHPSYPSLPPAPLLPYTATAITAHTATSATIPYTLSPSVAHSSLSHCYTFSHTTTSGGPAGSMKGGRQIEASKEILSEKNVPYIVAAPLLIQGTIIILNSQNTLYSHISHNF